MLSEQGHGAPSTHATVGDQFGRPASAFPAPLPPPTTPPIVQVPPPPDEPYRAASRNAVISSALILFTGCFSSPFALAFGISAWRGRKRLGLPPGGRATIGVVAGSIGTVILAIIVVSTVFDQLDDAERGGSGEIVESGDVAVDQLRVGDCVRLPSRYLHEDHEVEEFHAAPCDQPHGGEVVGVDDDFFRALSSFPGEASLFDDSEEHCIDQLDSYTGTSYDSSTFDVLLLVPSSASWRQGDRGVTCIGLTLHSDRVLDTTGSIRQR
jgi:hypothetical protein